MKCNASEFALVMMALTSCYGMAGPIGTLAPDRIILFDDYADTSVWTHEGPAPLGPVNQVLKAGTNHYHVTGWSLLDCRTGTPRGHGREIPPDTTANFQAAMANTTNAVIYSPLFAAGIGTIYFEAINGDYPVTIGVEVAASMCDVVSGLATNLMLEAETPEFVYAWQTVTNILLDAQSYSSDPQPHDFVRYAHALNWRMPVKLRIRRLDRSDAYPYDSQFAVIDNIRVAPPPTDVAVRKAESVFQPGYPSVNSNMTLRCYVDNVDANAPTESRMVYVFYRWRYLDQVVDGWESLLMAQVDSGDAFGNNQIFEAQMPAQSDVGDLEYYFACDFEGYRYQSPDYTGLGFAYPAEGLSPRILRGGTAEIDGREFYTRIRRHNSKYGAVYVVTQPDNAMVEMTLVGDDEWRGLVPVGGEDVTNLTWYFRGERAYVAGADNFASEAVCWAQEYQAEHSQLPYGARCVETNSAGSCSVSVDSSGYVQIRLNTRTLDYMACRAEYQNFNGWPADPESFSESYGQAQRVKLVNSFDGWETNVTERKAEYFAGFPSSTNMYWSDPRATLGSWVAGRCAYVAERTEAELNNCPSGMGGMQNLALRLKGGDEILGLGYICNSVDTRTDGLQEFSFKCRLGQPFDPADIIFNYDFFRTNYLVRAEVYLDSANAPEAPSVSVIAYYTGPQNFYEYRITQIPQSGNFGVDSWQRHELFKWKNGVATRLGDASTRTGLRLYNRTTVEMRLYTVGGVSTHIRCKYGAIDGVLDRTDSSAPLTWGSYGFLSADGEASFSNVQTQPTATGAVATGQAVYELTASSSELFYQQLAMFYVPAARYVGTASFSPYGLYSVVPSQTLGVYLYPSDRDSNDPPSAPGTLAWQLYTNVTVGGFGYATHTIPLRRWQADYVMLQVGAGGADVAVDELRVSSWRGQQASDSGMAGDQDWVAEEAWVVDASEGAGAAAGKGVQLDHSRADPELDQAVRSPVLDTGMGLMEFDYRVLRGPAKLTVQYALSSESGLWNDIKSIEVAEPMEDFGRASAYLGSQAPGYFRVVNERGGIYTNALVEIANAFVWDEPVVADSSWRVYNAKITETDLRRVSLDESKACFLNNSATEDASPTQDQDMPFVRSPRLYKGAGDIAFMARAYTNQSAVLYVMASTNGWNAPPEEWFEVHRFTGISNMLYEPYAVKLADGADYDAVRLETKIGDQRVCLDEIVVTEPVLPGFEIVEVKPLCKERDRTYSADRLQPVAAEEFGFEARLENMLLTPSNIVMYVSYYVGTNVWGVDNWPAGEIVTKPMYPAGEGSLLYRTAPEDDLPGFECGQVVQYRVWAEYMGGIPLAQSQTAFENPAWYYPVDLNSLYAAQGWSPYVIIYGLPRGSVWINEINVADGAAVGLGQAQYVEIAVPDGFDLGGWRLDFVQSDYTVRTITVPEGLTSQGGAVNGYKYFVIADAGAALPKLDYGLPGFEASYLQAVTPGGLVLRRPMGMYEHAIAYEWDSTGGLAHDGALWAEQDPHNRLVFVGREHDGGSLGVTNGHGRMAGDWHFPGQWTPGAPNENQIVPLSEALLPAVLVWLRGFPEGGLVPSYCNGRGLSLTELFWLDADPTVPHVLDGCILKVERDQATNYTVTVHFAVDGEKCTKLQGGAVFKVKVKRSLSERDWTTVAQYVLSSDSFDANHNSRIIISNLWYEANGVLSGDLFFRWVIETADPSHNVTELVNAPADP